MHRIFIGIAVAILLDVTIVSTTPNAEVDSQCSTIFDVDKEIGKSSQGRIYTAYYRDGNNPVVLKEFSGNFADRNFKEEYGILSEMETAFTRMETASTGVVIRRFSQLQTTCLSGVKRVIVTDCIPFGFEQKMGMKRTIMEDIYLIHNLIQAVDQLHSMGFVHLNLMPKNIHIDKENVVKLTDFGISQHLERRKGDKIGGTLVFMAPEVLMAFSTKTTPDYVKSKVDTWGVGNIAYELLMGHPLRSIERHGRISACLKTFNSPEHSSNKHPQIFEYARESLYVAIYAQTRTALQKQGEEYTVEQTNPPVIAEAAWKCAYKVGLEARPEAALLAELVARDGMWGRMADKLANLIFGKLLQFDPNDRVEMRDAMSDGVFHVLPEKQAHANSVRKQAFGRPLQATQAKPYSQVG